MAVPTAPTPTTIVTQALKRAGRTNPSTDQINEALENALQEVKTDLMLKAPTHPNLLVTATTVTTRGQQRYALPEDANEQYSIHSLVLLDGPDEWRGTAQNGTSLSITLAASLNVQADDIVGKYIIITSGPGIEEYREILAYDSGTRVATVDIAWFGIPTINSTYLIVNDHCKLWPQDTATEFDSINMPTMLERPFQVATFANEFLLYPVPMKSTYGLQHRYWLDLTKADEAEDPFLKILRQWRSIFIQGVAVKSMQRFDEDRYQNELSVYNFMLDTLASQCCRVTTIRTLDV